MADFRSQHRQSLPDGVVVDRLPLGFAAGRWWATFVCAMPGYQGSEPLGIRLSRSRPAWVHDPDDRLDCVGGSGGGSEHEYHYTWELVDHGARQARVDYVADGVEIGSESLLLDPGDRRGYSSTRLPDGSLIERLPIGRSQGMWRLSWVRSDVPIAEVEAAARDDEAFDLPHERFLRVRSRDGVVSPHQASGTIGGPIQPFGVDVPDALESLEVDYLIANEVVNTEALLLHEAVI